MLLATAASMLLLFRKVNDMQQMGKTWAVLNSQPLHDYLEEEEHSALMRVAEEADKDASGKFYLKEELERGYRKGLQEAICVFLDARNIPRIGDVLRTIWGLP